MQFFQTLFSSTSLLALLSATSISVSSAPVEKTLVRRGTASCRGGSAMGHFAHKWYVDTDSDTLGNWGQGLLDNLRGQCGVITNWQAGLNGNGISANFETTTFCNSNNVQDAIWLSSNPDARLGGIACNYSDDGSDPDVPGTAIQVGGEVAGALGKE